MKKGYLSDYFVSVSAKYLSAVEADGLRSNQHEFNGIKEFKEMLGSEKKTFDTTFLYLSYNEDKHISAQGKLTWYDARENHPTRSEYRLYYQSVSVFDEVNEGDLLLVCKREDNTLFVIISESGSTIENQICWLFNIENENLNKGLDFHIYEKNNTNTQDFECWPTSDYYRVVRHQFRFVELACIHFYLQQILHLSNNLF